MYVFYLPLPPKKEKKKSQYFLPASDEWLYNDKKKNCN